MSLRHDRENAVMLFWTRRSQRRSRVICQFDELGTVDFRTDTRPIGQVDFRTDQLEVGTVTLRVCE